MGLQGGFFSFLWEISNAGLSLLCSGTGRMCAKLRPGDW